LLNSGDLFLIPKTEAVRYKRKNSRSEEYDRRKNNRKDKKCETTIKNEKQSSSEESERSSQKSGNQKPKKCNKEYELHTSDDSNYDDTDCSGTQNNSDDK